MQNLEAAMAIATASHAPVERKLHTTREQYQAARADLEARARAGQTVQGRNRLGHFTRGVKAFTAGKAPMIDAAEINEISVAIELVARLGTRQQLEQAIERGISLLDALDGDTDLEDTFDCEVACEDEGADTDFEPSGVAALTYHQDDQRLLGSMSPFGAQYREVA